MKQFIKFLAKIKSFWKFYRNYGYGGERLQFIIENYQDKLKITQTDNKLTKRLEFSIEFSELINDDELPEILFKKIMELRGKYYEQNRITRKLYNGTTCGYGYCFKNKDK